MPDIAQPYEYSSQELALIEAKKAQPHFTHSSWGDEDLEPLRSALRSHYRQAQNGLCTYCRQTISTASAQNCHVEHIVPKSLHPEFIFEPKNLCVICAECNAIKRAQETAHDIPETLSREPRRYPRASSAFKIVHPHVDTYTDHIEVFHRFYLDRTPKGHFTIGACKLNRFLHNYGWRKPFFEELQVTEAMQEFMGGTDAMGKMAALDRLLRMLVL
jgi:5-methylcytosine-specific restriction endonuclease McrA